MTNRTLPRRQLTIPLEVRCASTGRSIGRIVDLSLRGLRLESDTPATLHGDYQLVIDATDGCGPGEPWRIDARCVWTGTDVDPPRHLAGFEFEEVRPRQREMLVRLIRCFGCD